MLKIIVSVLLAYQIIAPNASNWGWIGGLFAVDAIFFLIGHVYKKHVHDTVIRGAEKEGDTDQEQIGLALLGLLSKMYMDK